MLRVKDGFVRQALLRLAESRPDEFIKHLKDVINEDKDKDEDTNYG